MVRYSHLSHSGCSKPADSNLGFGSQEEEEEEEEEEPYGVPGD
jgi:hypothetical protein